MMKILRKNSVINAGWIIGARLTNKILAFLVGIITARYLGPSNYGLINYALAYTSFFASLCSLGINSVIVKNFIDKPDEEGETIGTTLVLRIVSSILSVIMIVCIVAMVDHDEPLTIIVVLLTSIGLVFQVFDTLNYWFQARLQSKYPAIATVISYIIVSTYKIILLVCGKNVKWFAVSNTVDYIVIAVVLIYIYRKKNGPKFDFSIGKAKELLTSSSSFIISGLMVSIYACTDKLMLKQMMDESSVGYYALASSISMMWTFVLSAIIDSVYPTIMRLHGNNKAVYIKRNKQLYAIVFYFSVFVSAAIAICAEPMICILYGESYYPTIQPLRIIVWYTAFSYLGVARNAWIVCENKQKYLKYIYISAAGINIVLNMLFIPKFGASGAAFASLITQIVTTMFLPFVIRELRENAKLMLEAILLKGVLEKD